MSAQSARSRTCPVRRCNQVVPYFQLAPSRGSSVGLVTRLKNGRKILYAFPSTTSGNTWRVPWLGAVSLNASHPWNVRNIVDYTRLESARSRRYTTMLLWTNLILSPVQRVPRVHTTFELVGIMCTPVASKDVDKAATECVVFPTLNRTAYADVRAAIRVATTVEIREADKPSTCGGCTFQLTPGWRIRKRSA